MYLEFIEIFEHVSLKSSSNLENFHPFLLSDMFNVPFLSTLLGDSNYLCIWPFEVALELTNVFFSSFFKVSVSLFRFETQFTRLVFSV